MSKNTSSLNLSGLALRCGELLLMGSLLYASLMAWVGMVVLSTRIAMPTSSVLPWTLGVAVTIGAAVLLWLWADQIHEVTQAAIRSAAHISNSRWILVTIGLGLVLRILWAMAFSTAPVSDGATYIQLARRLLAGEDYSVASTRAYWPPGYPIYLAPWLWLFDSQRIAIFTSNIVLYLLGASGVYALGVRMMSAEGARLALLLFAVWPNIIFQAGIPEKEQALIALMPWVLALWQGPRSADGTAPGWHAIFCGVALGAAMLVQPAVQLLIVVLFVCALVATKDLRRTLLALACATLGIVLVVGPWTWRNLQVFDHFVLISTNGGPGLFGANNPNATGGYLPIEFWPDDLLAMPELEADREGKRRAFSWITANPGEFARLAIEKNVRFMGDDAAGSYTTLNRNPSKPGGPIYAVFKGISNLFWLGVWSLIGCAIVRRCQLRQWLLPVQWVVPAAFLYSFALHSVVESAGKYHVLWTGVLCVLLPMLVINESMQNVRLGKPRPKSNPESRLP